MSEANSLQFPANIQTVLMVFNPARSGANQAAQTASRILHAAQIKTLQYNYQPSEIHFRDPDAHFHELAFEADVILVLGGDGTILGVARQIAENPRPLMGINLGGFGFLTSSAPYELETALQSLLAGSCRVIERYLLEARVIRHNGADDEVVFTSYALNEALVTLAQPGRLLRIWVGEHEDTALTYRGDGLIVATPTGSTGHSLSAGGPILDPDLPALIITPVSPHSLFNRPLVIHGDSDLPLWFDEGTEQLRLILDGQIHTELLARDRIRIRRSQQTIPTLTLPDRNFTQVLRLKFNLGHPN